MTTTCRGSPPRECGTYSICRGRERGQELVPHRPHALRDRRPARHRSSSTETASIGLAEPLGVAGVVAGGHQQPGGGRRLDAGGDDFLDQRVLDRPQPVELDERFVRARGLAEAEAVHRFEQFEQLPVVGAGLGEPLVEHLAALGQVDVAAPGDRGVLPQPGDRVEKAQPLLEPVGLVLPLGVERLDAVVDDVAFDAVVGAVAKVHVVVGGAEQAVLAFVVVLVVVARRRFVVELFLVVVESRRIRTRSRSRRRPRRRPSSSASPKGMSSSRRAAPTAPASRSDGRLPVLLGVGFEVGEERAPPRASGRRRRRAAAPRRSPASETRADGTKCRRRPAACGRAG